MLYMPADLYGRVSDAARLSGKTMAGFVRDALSQVVGVPKELTYHERLQIGYEGLKGVFKEDGVTYQRRLRAESEERFRRIWRIRKKDERRS